MRMADHLFGDSEQLADDVFRLSESIDSLVEARVSLEDFLEAIATRLNRVVEGYVFGQCLRSLPGSLPQRVHVDPGQLTLETADIDVRIDPPLPVPAAKFIRQRLIHAVKLIAHYDASIQVTESASDQIRLLLSAVGPESRRGEIRLRLGLADGVPVTVVAISGAGRYPDLAKRLAADLAAGSAMVSAQVGGVLAVILRRMPNLEVGVPEGLSIGIGEPFAPELIQESWRGATTALRFSLPSRRARGPYREFDAVIVDIRNVGPLRVLAEAVDQVDVRQLADVKAIRKLARDGLADTLSVLEAVAATESIRQAAKLVHLHHNTVAQRVEVAERILGFDFRGNYGRTRLLIGLTLHRLSSSIAVSADAAAIRPSEKLDTLQSI